MTESEQLLKDIFLSAQSWAGDWDLFKQMMGPFFMERLEKKSILSVSDRTMLGAIDENFITFPIETNKKGTVKTFELDKRKFQLMKENINRWQFMERPE